MCWERVFRSKRTKIARWCIGCALESDFSPCVCFFWASRHSEKKKRELDLWLDMQGGRILLWRKNVISPHFSTRISPPIFILLKNLQSFFAVYLVPKYSDPWYRQAKISQSPSPPKFGNFRASYSLCRLTFQNNIKSMTMGVWSSYTGKRSVRLVFILSSKVFNSAERRLKEKLDDNLPQFQIDNEASDSSPSSSFLSLLLAPKESEHWSKHRQWFRQVLRELRYPTKFLKFFWLALFLSSTVEALLFQSTSTCHLEV